MADLSLDLSSKSQGTAAYGDLLLVNGDLVLTSDVNPAGTNPVLQNVLQRLRMFLGEWFLDNRQGVPWLQQILTKTAAGTATDALLQNTILGTPGLVALLSYASTLNRANRTLTISFKAQSTSGLIDYASTLAPTVNGAPRT